jgi:hypothetical protein
MTTFHHPPARHHSPAGAWQRPAKGFVSVATLKSRRDGFGADIAPARAGVPREWQRSAQTVASIRAECLPKLNRLRTAAHSAHSDGDAALVINLMIDLVCAESMMLHDMARTSSASIEKLACERIIRRPQIDMLLDCALQVGDRDAKLLAEVLLQNYHRFMAAAVEAGAATTGSRDVAVT